MSARGSLSARNTRTLAKRTRVWTLSIWNDISKKVDNCHDGFKHRSFQHEMRLKMVHTFRFSTGFPKVSNTPGPMPDKLCEL